MFARAYASVFNTIHPFIHPSIPTAWSESMSVKKKKSATEQIRMCYNNDEMTSEIAMDGWYVVNRCPLYSIISCSVWHSARIAYVYVTNTQIVRKHKWTRKQTKILFYLALCPRAVSIRHYICTYADVALMEIGTHRDAGGTSHAHVNHMSWWVVIPLYSYNVCTHLVSANATIALRSEKGMCFLVYE